MKRKIAYIELDTHAEIALNFLEIMEHSEKFEVDYYFSEKISKLIGKKENITITSAEKILKDLENKNYNLLIIGTIHRYFKTFSRIIKKYKTAAIIHNLQFSKTDKWTLFSNIFKEETQYRLKLLAKENLLSSQKIHQQLAYKLVLDRAMQNSDYQYIPVFYSKNTNEKKENSTLKIAIAGAVSQKRRDYRKVLKMCVKFQTEMEILFCGKASGEELEWLKSAEKSLPKHIKISYFTEKIENKIYDDLLASADILWCPIQQETAFMSVPEQYGITKMSGNIGDAIKYRKPAIFPKNYVSDFDFIMNEEENIEQQFQNILNKNFDFQDFSKEKVLQNLENVIEKMI